MHFPLQRGHTANLVQCLHHVPVTTRSATPTLVALGMLYVISIPIPTLARAPVLPTTNTTVLAIPVTRQVSQL